MSIAAYLRDRIPLLMLMVVAAVLAWMLLNGTGASPYAAAFVISLYTLFVLVWVAIDFVRKYTFYRDARQWLFLNESANLPLNQVDRPGFAEGQVLYDAAVRLDASRQEALAQYVQSSREYREYIESWVHEIKTPLASARLFLDNHPGPGQARLNAELNRMEGYVTQVLYYARAASLEKDFRVRAVQLDALVRGLLKKHSMTLIEAGFAIEQERLEVEAMADAAWLEFVLGQVVSNAVKYRNAQPRLRFYAEKRPHCVLLHVQDNGIGIPAEDLPHVFEKGFCGQNGRTMGKSTGMGLYIAQKLCEKMGLSISAASVHGQGTRITLCFPMGDAYSLTKM